MKRDNKKLILNNFNDFNFIRIMLKDKVKNVTNVNNNI